MSFLQILKITLRYANKCFIKLTSIFRTLLDDNTKKKTLEYINQQQKKTDSSIGSLIPQTFFNSNTEDETDTEEYVYELLEKYRIDRIIQIINVFFDI